MFPSVQVTFLQDLNTWEGVYRKGTTHPCLQPIAKQLAAEGYVRINTETPAPAESQPVAPVTISRKSRKKKSL